MTRMKMNLPEGFTPEKMGEAAKENFLNGYNCCQAVVLAYADIIGLDRETALKVSSGFGGGMSRMREVCGAVSGMAMVAGFICPAADPSDKRDRTENYALVQELAGEYRRENGSIVCKELLGLVPMSPQENPEPSDRTPEYYRKRPCADLVRCAAEILGKNLLDNWG